MLTRVFAKLLNDGLVHVVEKFLVGSLLVVMVLLLVAGLIAVNEESVAVDVVMEDHVFDGVVVGLEDAVFVGELGNVVGGLGVVGSQSLEDHLFLLLLGQLLLLEAGHDGVLHVEEFVIVLQVVGDLFVHDLSLGGFLNV